MPNVTGVILNRRLLCSLRTLNLYFLRFTILYCPNTKGVPLGRNVRAMAPQTILLRTTSRVTRVVNTPCVMGVTRRRVRMHILDVIGIISLATLGRVVNVTGVKDRHDLCVRSLYLLFIV